MDEPAIVCEPVTVQVILCPSTRFDADALLYVSALPSYVFELLPAVTVVALAVMLNVPLILVIE